MKAIILAAGQGTRLRPLTDDRPKCLVELGGMSLLQRQVSVLQQNGITEIAVVTGYKAEKIAAKGYKTFHNPRYATTNMVESLFCASEWLDGSSDVIVAYGDIIYDWRVLQALAASTASVGLVVDCAWLSLWTLRMDDPLGDVETMRIDEEGYVRELGQKPRTYEEIEGQYIGLMKFNAGFSSKLRSIYDAMDQDAKYDGQPFEQMYMTSFLQHLIDQGLRVKAVEIDKGWLEVDSVEDLNRYKVAMADGSLQAFLSIEKINGPGVP